MKARLFSQWGETRGVEFVFDDQATVGRSEGNSLVLDSSAVSGEHARIRFDEALDCYMVEDLGSLNGTTVDGIKAEEPLRLDRLHVVNFGRVCEFVFQRLPEASAVGPGDDAGAGADGDRPSAARTATAEEE